MHALAVAQRDRSAQGFAIQAEQRFASLGLAVASRFGKELAEDLLDFTWINRLP
jgi:hypothetical protein